MANIGYLQVTRQCNQRCLFCSNPENDNLLRYEDAQRAVSELKDQGCTGVILTGGEPTLYGPLAELIAFCRDLDIAPRIISNGQKLADPAYFDALVDAGLDHVHLSLHSCRAPVQAALTGNEGSLAAIEQALSHCGERDVSVNINTVINAANADHLHHTVRWVLQRFPFVRHFVWNNLDPYLNRVREHPETIPRLTAFEVPLALAMRDLAAAGRTFRVERVPLCFMVEYPECSTETRKIVKSERRDIYFLDERSRFSQDSFFYDKGPACAACRCSAICAGLYGGDEYFSLEALAPLFLDPEEIARRVRGDP